MPQAQPCGQPFGVADAFFLRANLDQAVLLGIVPVIGKARLLLKLKLYPHKSIPKAREHIDCSRKHIRKKRVDLLQGIDFSRDDLVRCERFSHLFYNSIISFFML